MCQTETQAALLTDTKPMRACVRCGTPDVWMGSDEYAHGYMDGSKANMNQARMKASFEYRLGAHRGWRESGRGELAVMESSKDYLAGFWHTASGCRQWAKATLTCLCQ